MRFFDTHCHLQDERIKGQCESIILKAKQAGVRYFLCCGSTEADWDDVAEMARRYKTVIPAFGLHPWYVKERSSRWLDKLEQMLGAFPSASIGEIGLDHALDSYNREEQASVFCQQIECALRLKRPVSIHCRQAWGDLVEILSIQGGLANGGAIHSFSGSSEMVHLLDKLGCSFSFSGSITYHRNKRARKAVIAVPAEKLLIETDAPDIAPEGYFGLNEPSTIISVAATVAHLRCCSEDVCCEQIFNNSVKLFVK